MVDSRVSSVKCRLSKIEGLGLGVEVPGSMVEGQLSIVEYGVSVVEGRGTRVEA